MHKKTPVTNTGPSNRSPRRRVGLQKRMTSRTEGTCDGVGTETFVRVATESERARGVKFCTAVQ